MVAHFHWLLTGCLLCCPWLGSISNVGAVVAAVLGIVSGLACALLPERDGQGLPGVKLPVLSADVAPDLCLSVRSAGPECSSPESGDVQGPVVASF